jgi:hypothetical protein
MGSVECHHHVDSMKYVLDPRKADRLTDSAELHWGTRAMYLLRGQLFSSKKQIEALKTQPPTPGIEELYMN